MGFFVNFQNQFRTMFFTLMVVGYSYFYAESCNWPMQTALSTNNPMDLEPKQNPNQIRTEPQMNRGRF